MKILVKNIGIFFNKKKLKGRNITDFFIEIFFSFTTKY